MARLTKRVVDAAEARDADYFIWDDAAGRTRRYTIGLHGVWTPETARREARVLLGRIAQGENPSEERRLDHQAITVKELCERYLGDADKGLILGKGRRPKKVSTLTIDKSRIRRHIVPLLGARRVKDIASTDVNRFVRDVTAGRTKANVKTKARGRAIVRGGAGTAARAVGLLGGIFTYAMEQGIIEKNPAHGVRKQADRVKDRRLTEQEYRELGAILRKASNSDALVTSVAVVRFLALTGCRRSEAVSLKWIEVDAENSCLRFEDSKEGASVRPVGLSVLDMTDGLVMDDQGAFVFPGTVEGKPLVGFPKYWKKVLRGTTLEDVTPHVLRHSFASIANDLGFTEATVAALLGHSRGTVTSRYIHTIDTALIMAADTIAGYISGLLDGMQFKRTSYALDRAARQTTLSRLFSEVVGDAKADTKALAA